MTKFKKFIEKLLGKFLSAIFVAAAVMGLLSLSNELPHFGFVTCFLLVLIYGLFDNFAHYDREG